MRTLHRILAGTRVLFLMALGVPWAHAFTSRQIESVTASAVVGGGAVPLSIKAVPLDPQVFFQKNVVIGVNIVRTDGQPIQTKNLTVDLVYQLLDVRGQSIAPVTNARVNNLQLDPSNPTHLAGTALVKRNDFQQIQNGGSILYYFQALQGNTATVLSHAGAGVFAAPTGNPNLPSGDFFVASIINSQDTSVSPGGSLVSLPDTFQNDGRTALSFPAGAVSAKTLLTVKQNDPATIPSGPGGLAPVVAYTFRLQDGSLAQRPLQLTLSYPAELNGSITGTSLSPSALAPYWYGPSGWQLMSLPQLNSSLHTVSGMTTHFGTFALFPVGGVNAASLRTTQRIITPNGDGINDTASFSFVDSDVHIFDIHGRRVRTVPGPSPTWDGRDDAGRVVEVGVYLYQYSSQGTRVSGVIAVAK